MENFETMMIWGSVHEDMGTNWTVDVCGWCRILLGLGGNHPALGVGGGIACIHFWSILPKRLLFCLKTETLQAFDASIYGSTTRTLDTGASRLIRKSKTKEKSFNLG